VGYIVQLSLTPVPEEDLLSYVDFIIDERLLPEVADDVRKEPNPSSILDAFQRRLMSANSFVHGFQDQKGRGIQFHEGFREKYFMRSFHAFVRHARHLVHEITLDGFIHETSDDLLFPLQEAYNKRGGWYVFYEDMTITLDEFIRFARTDVRYYFGGFVYYRLQ